MAYMLSLRPHSPLKRSFSDHPYLQPCSPLKEPFLGPIGDVTARNASACSLYTLSSNRSNFWSVGNENTPPLASQSLLDLGTERQTYGFDVRLGELVPRKRTCRADIAPLLLSQTPAASSKLERRTENPQHAIEFSSRSESSTEDVDASDDPSEESDLFNMYEAIHVPVPQGQHPDKAGHENQDQKEVIPAAYPNDLQPFRRWMSTLRRRHLHRCKKQDLSFVGGEEVLTLQPPQRTAEGSGRRISESMTSSMGFVTAIKTTTLTNTSTSIAPTSEKGLHSRALLGNRSSHADSRRSTDSHRGGHWPIIDESAWLRSLQRRKVVEELIASEESYIADLKVLINVILFLTIIPALADISIGLLHDYYRPSCPSWPDEIIYPAEHSTDLAASRGSPC